ncbi:MAG: methyltransferase domain-containing protein, partial [Sandaracinaceae bacterium]
MTEPRRSSRRPSTRRRAVALDEGDPVVARTNGGRAPRAIDPYDAVPYNACPVAIAHPDRLAAAALRNGWVCTPPARCRVLELGCADATNLIPLAITYPSSQFVGVERSASQIGVARAELEALGIRNVELLHMDIEDLDEDLGEFDYIVAHSVFSWVSEHARARILRIMHANLSARGVAFLSYNTLPGWSLHGAIRDLLRAHTQEIDDPS